MLTCVIPNEARPCPLWDLQHVHCERITPAGKELQDANKTICVTTKHQVVGNWPFFSTASMCQHTVQAGVGPAGGRLRCKKHVDVGHAAV
jgi:hypothetical protein